MAVIAHLHNLSNAWWAGNGTPDDLPGLRLVVRLRDRVNRGDVKRAAELRQWMDSYGVTPRGQMDRRSRRPEPPRPMTPFERIRQEAAAGGGGGRYDHLRDENTASRCTGRPGR